MLYVGSDSAVINLLQQSLGAQFAGGENPGAMAVPPEDPTADPDARVRAYLGLMDDRPARFAALVAPAVGSRRWTRWRRSPPRSKTMPSSSRPLG